MKFLDPMKNRERFLLDAWTRLKDKGETTQLDHLKVQSGLSLSLLAGLCLLAAWAVYDFGFISFSTGVFLGGFAGVLGNFKKSQRDWNVLRKYLDWEAVAKENAEKNA